MIKKDTHYKYSSILNVKSKKAKGMLKKMNTTSEYSNVPLVATEKIDGGNFARLLTKVGTSHVQTRNTVLNEYVNFYNYDIIVKKYTRRIDRLIREVINTYDGVGAIVYGEIYGGGSYKDTNGVVQDRDLVSINGRINYTPEREFIVFDIRVMYEDHYIYLPWNDLLKFTTKYDLPTVPVVDTFDNVNDFITKLESNTFCVNQRNTKVHDLLGVSPSDCPKKNRMEGVVVRPTTMDLRGCINGGGMVKVISEEFREVSNKSSNKGSKDVKHKSLSPTEEYLVEKLTPYITINRIKNVQSKIDDSARKNVHRVAGLTLQDILSEEGLSIPGDDETVRSKVVKKVLTELIIEKVKL